MSKHVCFFDTTMRDGEQTPGVHITADQKVEIAQALEAFGVATIEAGFPASSPGDFAAVAHVAGAVRRCEVAALARCVPDDIDAVARALEHAVRPVVHVFLGVSDVHLTRKLGITRSDAIRSIEACVRQARQYCDRVQFSAEDATRTDRIFLRQCIETAITAGATRVNIPDTVGYALPHEYGDLIADIVRFVEGRAIVSAHCHDDMGMATANSIAAVEAGARQVEVTVNGIGERAGNASAEQVAVVLALKAVAETGIDLSRITAISRRVAEITGVPIQPNTPIVGANAFAHASGIHQDGIIKDPENYEFVPPTLVGAPGHTFVFTARSGRRAIAHRAAAMGRTLDAKMVDAVYRDFLQVAEQRRGEVPDEEIAAIIQRAACV